MAEIDSMSVTIPDPTHDDHFPSPIDDTTTAEHEDSALEAPGDLSIEDLAVSTKLSPDIVEEPIPIEAVKSKAETPAKKKVMATTTSKKPNDGQPTATVKKVINSGTFGAGAVKAAGVKGSVPTTPAVSKPTAPVLRKATTTTTKAVEVAPASNKPSAVTAAPNRRASVVPTRTSVPPPVKQSLSASVSGKLSSEGTAVRSSVASPTGSTASASAKGTPTIATRPRASVSEAAKKAPLSSRPSVATSAKAPPTKTTTISRSSAVPPARSSKPTGSISSIKEIKEDTKAFDELRAQLAEATQALEAKSELVTNLGSQVETLQKSLESVSTELQTSKSSKVEADNAKDEVEAQLQDCRKSLVEAERASEDLRTTLKSAQEELESASSEASSQAALVEQFKARINELQGDLSSSNEKIEALEDEHAQSATSASEAAAIEHEALLASQAKLDLLSSEVENLKAVHAKTLQDSESRIAGLLEKLTLVETLEAQVSSLKFEKEENANKLSELEVEILELKEAQDGLEDTRDILQKQVASLEDEVAKAAVSAAMAVEEGNNKDDSHAQELATMAKQHQDELEAGSSRYNELVASLEVLKSDLLVAETAKEKAEREYSLLEEAQAIKMAELEQHHATNVAALEVKIAKITEELQAQEAIYNSKVDAIKSEHARLVEDAFERAKSEAAQAHVQELNVLRSGSDIMIEDVRKSHRAELQTLKEEHASTLETEVNALTKQINTLNIELKATQDDLFKAKVSVEASQREIDTLTQQRDIARSQAEAVPVLSPEHANEIARLTRELSVTKDDLAAMTDMLEFTKSSMSSLSDKHSLELQEAAESRADEVSKLRDAHDIEVNTLARQKSDLLIRLSDLEGELATAKASLAAQQTASPKNVGNGISHSPSQTVTKEELTKLHEAHNLKIYDLEAGHEKAMKLVKEEMEASLAKVAELQQDLTRKTMEIQYLEQEQEESAEQITRLKEDLERLGHTVDARD